MRNRDRDQDRPGAGNRSEAGRGHRRARATQGAAKPDGGPPRRPGEDRGQRGPLRGGADPISARGVPGGGVPVDVRERSGRGDHRGPGHHEDPRSPPPPGHRGEQDDHAHDQRRYHGARLAEHDQAEQHRGRGDRDRGPVRSAGSLGGGHQRPEAQQEVAGLSVHVAEWAVEPVGEEERPGVAGEHPHEEVDAERGDQCGENAEQELRQPVVAQEQYEDPERGRVEQPAPGVGGSTVGRLGPARGDERPGPEQR